MTLNQPGATLNLTLSPTSSHASSPTSVPTSSSTSNSTSTPIFNASDSSTSSNLKSINHQTRLLFQLRIYDLDTNKPAEASVLVYLKDGFNDAYCVDIPPSDSPTVTPSPTKSRTKLLTQLPSTSAYFYSYLTSTPRQAKTWMVKTDTVIKLMSLTEETIPRRLDQKATLPLSTSMVQHALFDRKYLSRVISDWVLHW